MQVLFISVCSNKSAVIISGNQQREKAEDSKKQKKGKDFLVFFLVFFLFFFFFSFFFWFLTITVTDSSQHLSHRLSQG